MYTSLNSDIKPVSSVSKKIPCCRKARSQSSHRHCIDTAHRKLSSCIVSCAKLKKMRTDIVFCNCIGERTFIIASHPNNSMWKYSNEINAALDETKQGILQFLETAQTGQTGSVVQMTTEEICTSFNTHWIQAMEKFEPILKRPREEYQIESEDSQVRRFRPRHFEYIVHEWALDHNGSKAFLNALSDFEV